MQDETFSLPKFLNRANKSEEHEPTNPANKLQIELLPLLNNIVFESDSNRIPTELQSG
jgi:hypothetical protein